MQFDAGSVSKETGDKRMTNLGVPAQEISEP